MKTLFLIFILSLNLSISATEKACRPTDFLSGDLNNDLHSIHSIVSDAMAGIETHGRPISWGRINSFNYELAISLSDEDPRNTPIQQMLGLDLSLGKIQWFHRSKEKFCVLYKSSQLINNRYDILVKLVGEESVSKVTRCLLAE